VSGAVAASASAVYRHERLFKAAARKKQRLGRNIHKAVLFPLGCPIRPISVNFWRLLLLSVFIERDHRGASMKPFRSRRRAILTNSTFTARTRTTHRPTSHGPWPLFSVSDRRRPHGQRYPTLRWPDRLETAPKKAVECHFSMLWAIFSARRSPIAAAFSPAHQLVIITCLRYYACCTRLPRRRATGLKSVENVKHRKVRVPYRRRGY